MFDLTQQECSNDIHAASVSSQPYPKDYELPILVSGRRRRRGQSPVRLTEGRTLSEELTGVAARVHAYGKLNERLTLAVREALKRITRALPERASAALADAESLIHRLRVIELECKSTDPDQAPADAQPTQTQALLLAHQESAMVKAGASARPRRRSEKLMMDEVPAPGQAIDDPDGAKRTERRQARAEAVAFQDKATLDAHNHALELVLLTKRLGSIRAALKEMNLPASRVRWAERMIKRHREGFPLYDRRRTRCVEKTVRTEVVEQDILGVWNTHPSATIVEVVRQVGAAVVARNRAHAECGEPLEIVPSESTVRRCIMELPNPVTQARGGHLALFHAHSRLVGTSDAGLFPNDVWEQDSSEVPMYIKVRKRSENGGWQLQSLKIWASVIMDTFSRAVVGYALQVNSPDGELSIKALANAIVGPATPTRPFAGLPNELRVDRGSEFQNRLREVLARFEIVLTVSPPKSPNTRPFGERIFASLWARLSGLVGFVDADRGIDNREQKRVALYPTLDELVQGFDRVVVAYNHQVHSTTGEAPIERWCVVEDTRSLPEEYAYLLLTRDSTLRTVQATGVEWDSAFYTHPKLQDYAGRSVIVHYSPQHREFIEVLHPETHAQICTASLVATMSGEIHRETASYRKKIRERTKGYVEKSPTVTEISTEPEEQVVEDDEQVTSDAVRGRRTITASHREGIRRDLRAEFRQKVLARSVNAANTPAEDPDAAS